MSEHPIEGLMTTAMENIQQMVKVNTIVGDPVETQEGTVIIPISKVNFGFGAGGTDYQPQSNVEPSKDKQQDQQQSDQNSYNFGGGSGAGVMMDPMGFLIVNNTDVRLLRISEREGLDRLLNLAPDLIEQLQGGTAQTEQPSQQMNRQ